MSEKQEDRRLTGTLTIRVDEDTLDYITSRAFGETRSLGAMARLLLMRGVAADRSAQKKNLAGQAARRGETR